MAPARLVFNFSRSTRPPRMNSDATHPNTRVLNTIAIHEKYCAIPIDDHQPRIWEVPIHSRMLRTINATATSKESADGMVKLRFTLANDVLPQASNGPTAVRNIRTNPIGIVTLLKNGGPTLILYPRTQSERIGKSVPDSMANVTASSTRLLNKKLDSRETTDPRLFSAARCLWLTTYVTRQTTKIMDKKLTNHGPILDRANACTELTSPARVSIVPRIESMKVTKISQTFHTFIMPRFSCIMTECRNAVPVSQGKNDAFSTGSQPQYPPQPSTAYAQCAPRVMPQVRNSQVTMVQRRVM